MFIREFVEKNKVKLEGSWEQYEKDFRNATKDITDKVQMLTFLKTNRKLLDKFKAERPKAWAKLKSDLWDQMFGTWPAGHSTWAIPESQEDVDYVLKLLRNGLVVEQAGDKLYNVMGYDELFEAIEIVRQELPRTNFADTLANFIVKLEPKTPAIQQMQQAIISDAELSTLLLPPVQVKEGASASDIYAQALHEDLKFITDIGRWSLEEAQKKLVMRAMQAGISTNELKNRYVVMFEYDDSNTHKGLLGQDTSAYKAAIDLQKKFRHAKKTYGKVTPGQFAQILYKISLEHKVTTDEIEAKVKELFSTPKTTERKPAKTDWKIRHFTKEAQILDFAQKKQSEPNLAHLIDKCAVVLPSGSEAKWHTFMENTYGKDFARWFTGLMHYADHRERQYVGQNERDIYDYLKRNAEHDAKYIAIAKENIQDILTQAKAMGAEHGAQVLSQMKETTVNEYDEPKVFGRKKPEITIRKKSKEELEDEEARKHASLSAMNALYIPQRPPEEVKGDPWKITDYHKKHFDKMQQTGKHDLYQDRDRVSAYDWTAADNDAPNICPNCDGSGETPGRPDSKCLSCKGKGIIESYDMSSLRESINLILRRLPEVHWLSAVEEALNGTNDIVKKKALISTLVKMGLIEASVLNFQRPKTTLNKPNQAAYMASWAKQYLDSQLKKDKIKTKSDAENVEVDILTRVMQDANTDNEEDRNNFYYRTEDEFKKLTGLSINDYAEQKINESIDDSSKVFHGTSFDSALKIVKSNQILAKTTHVVEGKKVSGISLTTNADVAKKYGAVVFILDAKKLEENFKIVSFKPSKTATPAAQAFSEEFLVGSVDKLNEFLEKIIIKKDVFEEIKNKPEYKALVNNPKLTINEAQVLGFAKPQLDKSITVLKDFIDKTKVVSDQDVDKILTAVEKEEDRLKISFDDYSDAFEKKYGKRIMPYIDAKFMAGLRARHGGISEAQIINFPPFGHNNPKAMRDRTRGSAQPKLEINSADSIEFFCEKMKQYVDKTDLSTSESKDHLLKALDAGLAAIRRSPEEFYKTFEDMYGEDFGIYYINKSSEDKGVLEASESNILFMLVESFKGETAHRVRVELAKIIRSFVDSSDISLLSNFESYEEQPHISLKMNVYQDTVKDLSHVIDSVKGEMLDHGFTQSKGPNMFVKGNIVVKLLPIRKTFRTGPYKNRETPTWGIEVIGPKKLQRKEKPTE